MAAPHRGSGLAGADAASVAQAIGLMGSVTKSGYLTKLAKKSGRNWKKRYFVLSGHSLTYYVTHQKDAAPKGNVLLTEETTVKLVADGEPGTFDIITNFETMTVQAASAEEAEQWMSAIVATVQDEVGETTRDYMEMQVGGMMGKSFKNYFFMLHLNSITYHTEHLTTFKNLGVIKLTGNMKVTRSKDSKDGELLTLDDDTDKKVYVIRGSAKDKTPNETLDHWKARIEANIAAIKSMSDLAVQPGETNTETAVKDGYLFTRDEKGGSKPKWNKKFYALTTSALYMAESADAQDALFVFPLNPSCSVFETNLKPDAFELVTSKMALHVQAGSHEEVQDWISELRRVISESSVSNKDPLVAGAKKLAGERLENLEKYDVHFEVKKPLGIVLERSREWALVKLSNVQLGAGSGGSGARGAEVTEGSALFSINDEPVLLKPYTQAIKLLTGWRPPLKLSFIRAPVKEGWLAKMSRGRDQRKRAIMGSAVNWRQRYFILKQGKLAYFAIDAEQPELKGCVQLMGSAVSLVSNDEIGKNFCFRLVSGVATLYMQAENIEDMMGWATTLYHAIAVANGGGYLLDVARSLEKERTRAQMAEVARDAELAEAKAAEAAAIAEQAAKDKAAADEKAEAEARATAETEAVAAAAAAEAAAAEAAAKKEDVEDLEAEMASMELATSNKTAVRKKRNSVISQLALEPEPEDEEGATADGGEAGGAADAEGAPSDAVKPLYQLAPELSVQDGDDEESQGTLTEEASAAAAADEEDETVDDPLQVVAASDDPLDATDEQIATAFKVMDHSGKGQLNPMQFSNVLRMSGVSAHNMHTEMSWYKMFDADGQVGISLSDITQGMHGMRKNKGITDKEAEMFATYVKSLCSSGAFAL